MSNRSLRDRIAASLESFRNGESTLQDLRDSISLNGPALETMPYKLITDIDALEYEFTVATFHEEEGFETALDDAIKSLEAWLQAVPVEENDGSAA